MQKYKYQFVSSLENTNKEENKIRPKTDEKPKRLNRRHKLKKSKSKSSARQRQEKYFNKQLRDLTGTNDNRRYSKKPHAVYGNRPNHLSSMKMETPRTLAGSKWHIPSIPCTEPQDGVFHAQLGPTAYVKGYNNVSDIHSWGITWYINGLLIPELNVVRGRKYTFLVEGGSNYKTPDRYHPFYITNDPMGGYLSRSDEDRKNFKIYAGASFDAFNETVALGLGRFCYWSGDTEAEGQAQDVNKYKTFEEYQESLSLVCEKGTAGEITWTPNSNTPDTVYYQCLMHVHPVWKINVLDSCDLENSEPANADANLNVGAESTNKLHDLGEFSDVEAVRLDISKPTISSLKLKSTPKIRTEYRVVPKPNFIKTMPSYPKLTYKHTFKETPVLKATPNPETMTEDLADASETTYEPEITSRTTEQPMRTRRKPLRQTRRRTLKHNKTKTQRKQKKSKARTTTLKTTTQHTKSTRDNIQQYWAAKSAARENQLKLRNQQTITEDYDDCTLGVKDAENKVYLGYQFAKSQNTLPNTIKRGKTQLKSSPDYYSLMNKHNAKTNQNGIINEPALNAPIKKHKERKNMKKENSADKLAEPLSYKTQVKWHKNFRAQRRRKLMKSAVKNPYKKRPRGPFRRPAPGRLSPFQRSQSRVLHTFFQQDLSECEFISSPKSTSNFTRSVETTPLYRVRTKLEKAKQHPRKLIAVASGPKTKASAEITEMTTKTSIETDAVTLEVVYTKTSTKSITNYETTENTKQIESFASTNITTKLYTEPDDEDEDYGQNSMSGYSPKGQNEEASLQKDPMSVAKLIPEGFIVTPTQRTDTSGQRFAGSDYYDLDDMKSAISSNFLHTTTMRSFEEMLKYNLYIREDLTETQASNPMAIDTEFYESTDFIV